MHAFYAHHSNNVSWMKIVIHCNFIHSFICQWLYSPLLGPSLFFSFVIIFYTDGRTPWTSDQPVARPLPTHRTTQTQNKRTQTSIPWMRFEPTIPAFEGAKTVHALDRAATVIGIHTYILIYLYIFYLFIYIFLYIIYHMWRSGLFAIC
jgi:hypothetical protein